MTSFEVSLLERTVIEFHHSVLSSSDCVPHRVSVRDKVSKNHDLIRYLLISSRLEKSKMKMCERISGLNAKWWPLVASGNALNKR
jgi:hypothetical protein